MHKNLKVALISTSFLFSGLLFAPELKAAAEPKEIATYRWQAHFYEVHNNPTNVGIFNTKLADYYQSIKNTSQEISHRKKAQAAWIKANRPYWAYSQWDNNDKRLQQLTKSNNIGEWIWLADFYIKNNNFYNAGYYYWCIGNELKNNNSLDESIAYYQKSASYFGRAANYVWQTKAMKEIDDAMVLKSVKNINANLNRSIETKNWTNAAIYSKQIAEAYEKKQMFEKAAVHYENSGKYWKQTKNPEWGFPSTKKAEELRSDIQVYVQQTTPVNYQLGKFEPTEGVYLGMYPGNWLNWNYDKMTEKYGKQAIVLDYANWGDDFHKYGKAEKIKSLGGAIQIGFQPMNGLQEVQDGAYIRNWAREAKKLGVPIFLRFACEFNGNWLPWDGNPQLYKEKFRLIHDIMEQEAPNVAMVWSPNFLPRDNIDAYYPGDKYVDWVGVSLYALPLDENGKEKLTDSFANNIGPIYEKYKNKPFMISESGVVRHSYKNNKSYTQWSERNLRELLNQIPKMFPRIKAITYFNVDGVDEGRDFSLRGNLDTIYQKSVKEGPYLRDIQTKVGTTEKKFVPISEATSLKGRINVYVENKLPNGIMPTMVALFQDGRKIGESYGSPWNISVDFNTINKSKPIVAKAFNSSWQVVLEKSFTLKK